MTEDRFKTRFDGVKAFAALPPDVQTAIGAVALEFALTQSAVYEAADIKGRDMRPFNRVEPLLFDKLDELTRDVIGDAAAMRPIPVPSLLGGVCRRCGCSEHDACVTDGVPCHWVEADLCSACAGKAANG